MKLKRLHIQNYKSLVDLEITEPNPFTVFAGSNGSGKSNIFEAMEFLAYTGRIRFLSEVESMFGGQSLFLNFNSTSKDYRLSYDFERFEYYIGYGQTKSLTGGYGIHNIDDPDDIVKHNSFLNDDKDVIERKPMFDLFFKNHSRIFIKNESLNRIKYTSDQKLLPDASNLEAILKNMLSDERKEDLMGWLDLFVPGFEGIEIHSDNISDKDTLLIYEKGTRKPFPKSLISDGTYNILCLLAAVYQSDEPQFLCIEEPENGLNPYVVRSLVDFFRQQCEEKGHYIWLNTHSQTLVKALHPHELILVDKVNGATTIKQFPKDYKLFGLEMDEAWLSNALGGGLPW